MRWLRGLTALALSIAVAAAAIASEPSDEADRWSPSIGVFFDALGQKLDGAVSTGRILGPPLDPFDAEEDALAPGNGCVRRSDTPAGTVFTRTGTLCATSRQNPSQILFPDDEGNDTSVATLVGASLELMTPSPLAGWSRPRLFVHGDLAAAFSFERNVAGVESPDEFALPPGIIVVPGTDSEAQNVEERSIVGQGTRSRIQVRRLVWSAGGGIAFRFDVLGRRIRIKPSIEYLRQELDLIGVAHRAVKLQEPTSVTSLRHFRLISLTREEQESYDGLGPGLELEIDAARLGPLVSSVYVMGRGYHLFGDLETTFSQVNQYGETATWTFEPESWVWRGGVGFRVRWQPEAD